VTKDKVVEFGRYRGLQKIHVLLTTLPTNVEVAIGPAEDFERYMKEYHPDDPAPDLTDAVGHCRRYEGYEPVIWIPRVPETPEEHGTLCHEACHAAFFVFETLGMEASDRTSEAFNYLVGWVVNMVLKHGRRKSARQKSQKTAKRSGR
jgi:hypothetical protein